MGQSSVIPDRKPRRKPRPKRDQSISDEVLILDGEVKLFRKKGISGDVWQFYTWLREERKNFYKSTRTTDLDEAKQVAKDLWIDIVSKQRHGIPVMAKRFDDVAVEFLSEEEKRTKTNPPEITLQRYKTIQTQIKHFIEFWEEQFGRDAGITRVPKNLDVYFDWRRTNLPSVVSDTLLAEKSTFLKLMNFAVEKNYLPHLQMPRMRSPKKSGNRREHIDIHDYRKMTDFMKSNAWTKDANAKFVEQRQFVRYFILLLANYGMRFGEGRQIRWEQVKIWKDDTPNAKLIGRVDLDANQTKNRRKRQVVGRRGDIFSRLKSLSKHTTRQDLLFVDNDTGNAISKDVFYKWWQFLLDGAGIQKPYTFYSLRHSYATWRLGAGVSVEQVSVMMGTDIKHIQNHYWHPEIEKHTKQLTADLPPEYFADIPTYEPVV